MSSAKQMAAVAVLLGAACGWQSTPVPVRGDLELLRGRWEGGYSSVESGRNGSIVFELSAGADSAFGDVLMIPEPSQGDLVDGVAGRAGARPRLPQPIPIGFVRCDAGDITGTLAAYLDPESGERLFTTFEGRLVGREFKGTYRTRVESTGRLLTGEWSVRRTRA